MSQVKEKFWLVANLAGGRAPTVRHPSKTKAKEEAGRLAAKHPGEIFVILESMGECQAVKVGFTKHARAEECMNFERVNEDWREREMDGP